MDDSIAKETKCLITSLITSNPLRCTVNQLARDFRNFVGYDLPYRQLGYTNAEAYLRSIPDTVNVYGAGPSAEVDGVIKPSSAHINLMVAKQKKNVPPQKRKYMKTMYNMRRASKMVQQQAEQNLPSTSYDNSTSEEENIKENVKSVPTVAQPTNPPPGFEEYKSRIPREVQNNLEKLIKRFPDGIWCCDLNKEYRKLFGKYLRFDLYNYRSLIEMCADLPEIFHYVRASSDDYILYDISKPIPERNQNEPIMEKENANGNVSHVADIDDLANELKAYNLLVQWAVPEDVCYLNHSIPRFFPDDLAVGDVLEVFVSEIYDLSKFWICMYYGEIEELMENLNLFFNANSNKYLMPECIMREGLYCATLYNNEYHRAVINNMLPNQKGFVRVLFIDFGTVCDVATSKIWYLPTQFGSTPAQSIRARLSNIYPATENTLWDVEAIERFRKLINSQLVAEITDVNNEDKIVEVYLADISNKENIYYINEKLVEEGLAIYTDQKQKSVRVNPLCKPNVRHIHLYPDFYEIEMGAAPTPADLNYIIENNIPMHHYLPQYFDMPCPETVPQMAPRSLLDAKQPPVTPDSLDLHLSLFPAEMQDDIAFIDGSIKQVQTYSCSKKRWSDSAVSISPISSRDSSDSNVSQYSCKKKNVTVVEEAEVASFPSTNPFINMMNKTAVEIHPTNPFYQEVLECRRRVENENVCSQCRQRNSNFESAGIQTVITLPPTNHNVPVYPQIRPVMPNPMLPAPNLVLSHIPVLWQQRVPYLFCNLIPNLKRE